LNKAVTHIGAGSGIAIAPDAPAFAPELPPLPLLPTPLLFVPPS
jgi:hypothetical protein